MSIEIRGLPGQAAAAATSAVMDAAAAAGDPVGTARRRIRSLERGGGSTNRKVEKQVQESAGEAARATREVGAGTIPERVLLEGLKLVRRQARRRDLLGEAAFLTLTVLNGGLSTARDSLSRLERASQPPARAGLNRPAATPARQAARHRGTKAATGARKATQGKTTG